MTTLIAIPFIVLFIVGSIILDGWVISVVWSWFMPRLFNLPILSIPAAIGVSCLLSSFKSIPKRDKEKTDEGDVLYYIGMTLLKPALILLTAYIAKCYL
jgi:hypothetical protein